MLRYFSHTSKTAAHPLATGQPPAWASGWGQDSYGVWLEFTVHEVSQRLRWIREGSFRMGSPDGEPGRYNDEGPQHNVTISNGFWLFATPCSQELYQAVLADKANPSRFQSPKRPVEQVSWNDVQGFLERINGLLPGLDLTLPTEAQWEYCCRAGTEDAIYKGEYEILGENNAPALDSIAWYGGNSGHEFELENGYDNSDWSEKQYPHSRAGTREVGLKQANPWGLYDMLGNVWEWCLDGQRDYEDCDETDPSGSLEKSGSRVVRGGSWNRLARNVRSASRYASEPGFRHDDLGFRCARVQKQEQE